LAISIKTDGNVDRSLVSLVHEGEEETGHVTGSRLGGKKIDALARNKKKGRNVNDESKR
jgi:hypothetical protein